MGKLTQSGIKPFKCDTCGREFSRRSSLIRHLSTHTGVKAYKCNICEREISHKATLIRHLSTHTGIKAYKCDHCGREFFQSRLLKLHLVTHTGVKDFKCDHCGREFFQSRLLKLHLVTHTGVKPYKCDICDRGFSQSNTLKRHLVTHTGVKDFKCDTCGREFSQSTTLKRHLSTHTGKKRFKCRPNTCERECSKNSSLQTHILRHSELPFKCNACGREFDNEGYLQTHIRLWHKPLECKTRQRVLVFTPSHTVIHGESDTRGKLFRRPVFTKEPEITQTLLNTYKCDFSGTSFKKETNLKSHLVKHSASRCEASDRPFVDSRPSLHHNDDIVVGDGRGSSATNENLEKHGLDTPAKIRHDEIKTEPTDNSEEFSTIPMSWDIGTEDVKPNIKLEGDLIEFKHEAFD